MKKLLVSCLLLSLPLSAFAGKKPKKGAPAPDATDASATTMQPKLKSAMTFDQYEHLLNMVLPIDHAVPPQLEYTMVLRFEPHIHPEEQITIRQFRDGHLETSLLRVDQGNAWQAAAGNMGDGQTPDYAAMVKQIAVRKNSFMLAPEQAARWKQELFPMLEKEYSKVKLASKKSRSNGERVADGTRFELWYIHGDDEIHQVVWDSEVEAFPTGSFALTKWMNVIRWYADGHRLAMPAPKVAPPRQPLPMTASVVSTQ